MAGFTENALVRKLQELNSSQQSIQTLSLWLIHHRKHHAAVVKTWYKELLKGINHNFLLFSTQILQNYFSEGLYWCKFLQTYKILMFVSCSLGYSFISQSSIKFLRASNVILLSKLL